MTPSKHGKPIYLPTGRQARQADRSDIILYGGPASGKTTQAKLLASKLRATPIFVGARLRDLAKQNTSSGREIAALMNQGKLISHTKLIQLLKQWIDSLPKKKRFISDGVPRDSVESVLFDKLLGKYNRQTVLIYLKLPLSVAMKRITSRAIKENRPDDQNKTAVKNRIKIFQRESKDIIDYFKKDKRLIVVDAAMSPVKINDEIIAKLKQWH